MLGIDLHRVIFVWTVNPVEDNINCMHLISFVVCLFDMDYGCDLGVAVKPKRIRVSFK